MPPDHRHKSPGKVGCRHTAAEAREPLNRPNVAALDRFVFKIEGLDCAEEVAILKREIAPLVGGADKLGRMRPVPRFCSLSKESQQRSSHGLFFMKTSTGRWPS